MLRLSKGVVVPPPSYSKIRLEDETDVESLDLKREKHNTKSVGKYLQNVALGVAAVVVISLVGLSHRSTAYNLAPFPFPRPVPPPYIDEGLAFCDINAIVPGPAPDFHLRTKSDRFEEGTGSYLIFNATLWTGQENATEIIHEGKILLEGGLIKAIGGSEDDFRGLMGEDVEEINAFGSWVTPGIVDAHSHAGVGSLPGTEGTNDGNSLKSNTNPYLRSLDGFNTHDAAFELIVAGGTTTNLVLPGSADAIGGQAFVFKFRKTKENTPESMLVESPFESTVNSSSGAGTGWKRNHAHQRHMKHAFGENPSRVYAGTRMDTLWDFRRTYKAGQDIKLAQDHWCDVASNTSRATEWAALGPYPESSLDLEAIVDILRHKTKLNYEAVDITALSRLTNEFEFKVAAIHHAHEAHIVPGVIKKMFGGGTGAAIFAAFSRYKHEAYRHSVFAPKILADAGVPVIMKSDHPAIFSRYLLHEAVQAHYYGLEANLALASVTTTPATLMGLSHRVGFLGKGYDADIVIWQSHPLQLGATPSQVFIDGIPQLLSPQLVLRSAEDQLEPPSADFSREIKDVVESHGDPDLSPSGYTSNVIFVNVGSIYRRSEEEKDLVQLSFTESEEPASVVVSNGEIVCEGHCAHLHDAALAASTPFIDLKGGSVSPGLTVIGPALGLAEIDMEASWSNGAVGTGSLSIPTSPVPLAYDGLMFEGKEQQIDLRAGVVNSITPPLFGGLYGGMSTFYSIGASNKLEEGAILNRTVALHVQIGHNGPAVSDQISSLRSALMESKAGISQMQTVFSSIARGMGTLVIHVQSADQMASLVEMKYDVENAFASKVRFVFFGANEAHLIAHQIAKADIAVVAQSRGYPGQFDSRRVLPGAPLTAESEISVLKKAGVLVAVGLSGMDPPFSSAVSTLRFFLAFTLTDTVKGLTKIEAMSLATTNLEKIFGVKSPRNSFVAVEHGDLLDVGRAKVIASASGDGKVALFT